MVGEKIIILGGTGFVGTYLAAHLNSKFQVTTTSTTGKNADVKLNLLEGDWIDLRSYKYVINCIVEYSEEAERSFEVNVKSVFRILNQMAQSQSRYINISSVSALNENKMQSMYAHTKYLSDEIVAYHQERNTLKTVTLRFSQIYDAAGKARKSQPGLFHFAQKIKHNEGLTIFGNKGHKRSYIPVEVLCQCVEHVIENGITGSHNVIMNDAFTPFELAQVLAGFVNYDVKKIVFEEKKASSYFIPEPSPIIQEWLSKFSNIPYFKALLENV